MKKEYEKKLLESIFQSGFPLELEIIEALRDKNYLTFPNISFPTAENGIKELDIVSIIHNEDKQWQRGPVGIQLLAECKKTKYPWVFFDEGENPLYTLGMLFRADYLTDFISGNGAFNPLAGCQTSGFMHHYNDASLPKVRTYMEAFKQSANEPTAIFKAILNILHGRKFLKESFYNNRKENLSLRRTMLHHYCIVVDGEMILARKKAATFELENINHLLLLAIDTIGVPDTQLTGNEILIDVIRKEYFNRYLDIMSSEIVSFCEHLKVIDKTGLEADRLFL